MIRRCCNLHIVARAHRAIRASHAPRLRIGERSPRFFLLGDLFRAALGALGFLRFDLDQFAACLFDPLLRLAQASSPRRLCALGTRRPVRIDLGFQGGDARLRCRLSLVQTQRALVRALARRSLDFGAVDHDLVGVKQSLRQERRQRLGEQIVKHIGMRHAEVRKPVVVDRHPARDPAIGQILDGRTGPVPAPTRPRPSSPKATKRTAQLDRQQADRPSPPALRSCRRAPSNQAYRRTPPPIARGGPAPTSHPDSSGPTTVAPGSQPQPEPRHAPSHRIYDPSKKPPPSAPLNYSLPKIEMISSQARTPGPIRRADHEKGQRPLSCFASPRQDSSVRGYGTPSSQTKCNTFGWRCCHGAELRTTFPGRSMRDCPSFCQWQLGPANRGSYGSLAISDFSGD